jgi:hypothetical protein
MSLMLAALLAAATQTVLAAPAPQAPPPPGALRPPAAPKPGSLSLVVATSGTQTDPRPAPCGPNGDCNDFHYLSTFSAARTLDGAPLPESFEARLRLHTPYISKYRLALIVERLDDGSLIVRKQTAFNGRNGIGCFYLPSEWPVDWQPQAPEVRYQGNSLCVFQASEIDPNAPKD